jgi:prepilin peptidase CpaA
VTGFHWILVASLLFAGAAAWTDLRTGQIPNRLTFFGLAFGAVLHLAVHCFWLRGPDEALASVALSGLVNLSLGVVACGLVPYLLFRKNAMGGGDVKLLSALGAFLGPVVGIEVEFYAFVLAALYAPARLAYQGQLLRVLKNSAILLLNPLRSKEKRQEIEPALLTSLKFGPAVLAALALVAVSRVVVS